ncbi:retropepsin-like aspartic protease, partial [Xanthovirga aplysinae]|uniref:retropepsin-like aspartic protease n=1 Tax=Xanthovirga aplysinae TaxID=2529853 RepID=UPI0012BC7A4B
MKRPGKVNLKNDVTKSPYFFLMFLCFFCFKRAFAKSNGFVMNKEVTTTTIPFELINQLIIVPVNINGLQAKFIIDTGVRTPLLFNRQLIRKIKGKVGRSVFFSGAGSGKKVSGKVISGIDMEIGNLKGERISLVALDRNPKFKLDEGATVDGVIGYQLFSKFIVSIDYDKKLLTFAHSKKNLIGEGFEEIPIHITDTKPYLNSNICMDKDKDLSVKLLIDTGASHTLLLETGSKLEIVPPKKSKRSQLGNGLGGIIRGKNGKIPELRIKEFTFNHVQTSFPARDNYSKVPHTDGRHGTIGNGLLKQFHIVLDYMN